MGANVPGHESFVGVIFQNLHSLGQRNYILRMTSSDRVFFPIVGGKKIKIKIGLFPEKSEEKIKK